MFDLIPLNESDNIVRVPITESSFIMEVDIQQVDQILASEQPHSSPLPTQPLSPLPLSSAPPLSPTLHGDTNVEGESLGTSLSHTPSSPSSPLTLPPPQSLPLPTQPLSPLPLSSAPPLSPTLHGDTNVEGESLGTSLSPSPSSPSTLPLTLPPPQSLPDDQVMEVNPDNQAAPVRLSLPKPIISRGRLSLRNMGKAAKAKMISKRVIPEPVITKAQQQKEDVAERKRLKVIADAEKAAEKAEEKIQKEKEKQEKKLQREKEKAEKKRIKELQKEETKRKNLEAKKEKEQKKKEIKAEEKIKREKKAEENKAEKKIEREKKAEETK